MWQEKTGIRYEQLDELTAKYPWFHSAAIMKYALDGRMTRKLSLYMASNPRPAILLHTLTEFPESEVTPPEHGNEDITSGLIEKFLAKGDYRIVPDEATTEEDVAKTSGELEITDEIATAELAEIYEKQGLADKAEEIRNKLRDQENNGSW